MPVGMPPPPPAARPLGHTHRTCPILCITKVCLFVVTTLFVLYLPLGDPQIICDARNVPSDRKGLICLCDVYHYLMKLADYTVEVIDQLACTCLDALYEAKLKLYTALSTYDRDDYCRVGSCSSNEEEDGVRQKRPCKCKSSKCCRKR